MNIQRFPRHAPIRSFDIAEGELAIGGMPLTRLAARVGRAPFYAYSRAAIAQRVADMSAAPSPLR